MALQSDDLFLVQSQQDNKLFKLKLEDLVAEVDSGDITDTDDLPEGSVNLYFQEAPINGNPYVRQDAGWIPMPSSEGGASVDVGDTAPSNPSEGDLWYNTADGVLLVYYTDDDSSQWVDTNPSGGSGGGGGDVVAGVSKVSTTDFYSNGALVVSPTTGDVEIEIKNATETTQGVVKFATATEITDGTTEVAVDASQLKTVSDAAASTQSDLDDLETLVGTIGSDLDDLEEVVANLPTGGGGTGIPNGTTAGEVLMWGGSTWAGSLVIDCGVKNLGGSEEDYPD